MNNLLSMTALLLTLSSFGVESLRSPSSQSRPCARFEIGTDAYNKCMSQFESEEFFESSVAHSIGKFERSGKVTLITEEGIREKLLGQVDDDRRPLIVGDVSKKGSEDLYFSPKNICEAFGHEDVLRGLDEKPMFGSSKFMTRETSSAKNRSLSDNTGFMISLYQDVLNERLQKRHSRMISAPHAYDTSFYEHPFKDEEFRKSLENIVVGTTITDEGKMRRVRFGEYYSVNKKGKLKEKNSRGKIGFVALRHIYCIDYKNQTGEINFEDIFVEHNKILQDIEVNPYGKGVKISGRNENSRELKGSENEVDKGQGWLMNGL